MPHRRKGNTPEIRQLARLLRWPGDSVSPARWHPLPAGKGPASLGTSFCGFLPFGADVCQSAQKRVVANRAGGCCEYCRSPARYSPNPFAIEHIIPRSQGGKTVLRNIAYSCQGCNNHKYAHTHGIDSMTGRETPLYHPCKQRWRDHFAWNDDYTLIEGSNPPGRATVETLHLNREELVNLHRVLHSLGEHPPPEPRTSRRHK
jgi:5-methylcytosine-specific restriction endonuclease McrA